MTDKALLAAALSADDQIDDVARAKCLEVVALTGLACGCYDLEASTSEQGDRDIPPGQALSHDAGTDHGGQQEGRPESLSYSTPAHSTPLVSPHG